MRRWPPAVVACLTVVTVLVALATLAFRRDGGRPSATGPARQSAAALPATTTPATTATSVLSTPQPPPTPPPPPPTTVPLVDAVAFVGDSLGDNLGSGLASAGPQQGIAVFDDAISGCGVATSGAYRLSGVRYELSPTCAAWSETWAERLRRDRPKVVAVQLGRHEVVDRLYKGRWTDILDPEYRSYVRSELERGIRIAGADGAKVVLLTAPMFRRPPQAGGGQWPENDPARVERFNDLLRELAGRDRSLTVIDLAGRTSPGGSYADVVDGVTVRSDGVHYSAAGVEWIGRWLLPQLARLLRP